MKGKRRWRRYGNILAVARCSSFLSRTLCHLVCNILSLLWLVGCFSGPLPPPHTRNHLSNAFLLGCCHRFSKQTRPRYWVWDSQVQLDLSCGKQKKSIEVCTDIATFGQTPALETDFFAVLNFSDSVKIAQWQCTPYQMFGYVWTVMTTGVEKQETTIEPNGIAKHPPPRFDTSQKSVSSHCHSAFLKVSCDKSWHLVQLFIPSDYYSLQSSVYHIWVIFSDANVFLLPIESCHKLCAIAHLHSQM